MNRIQHYSPASGGGMQKDDGGRWLEVNDVVELLSRELDHNVAQALIHRYIDAPETCDDRELADA